MTVGQMFHLCKRPRHHLSYSDCDHLIQQKFWPTEILSGELCIENHSSASEKPFSCACK